MIGTSLIVVLAFFVNSGCPKSGCSRETSSTLKQAAEVVEIVASPSEQEVGDSMRPIRGEQRLLVFAIDGLGRNEMADILASKLGRRTGELVGEPTARGDDVYERGYLADDTLTILPSSTIAAWTTIFTGASPAENGVPGNEFFLRDRGKFFSFAPTSISNRTHALKAVNDGLLNDLIETSTVYEQLDLRAHVSLSQIYRGADLITTPRRAILEFIRSTSVSPATDEPVERGPFAAIDEESFESMEDGWEEHGLPDVQVAYLPGLDLYSHGAQDVLQMQPEYFDEVIDPFVGDVLAGYEERGVLEDTWVVFISDHGHTPVLADAEHALEVEDFEDRFAEIGYTLRPARLDVDPADFNTVLASQGGLGYLYVANRSRCQVGEACFWTATPRWEQDVLPLVRLLERYNADADGLDGKIAAILTRDPADPDAPFRVWDRDELHPIAKWFQANDLDHQVDFERRLRGLTRGPHSARAGEIILVPKYGMKYPIEERYYFAKPMFSEHGSGTIEDSLFTLLVVHPQKSGAEIARLVEAVTDGSPQQHHFAALAKKLLDVD